MANWELVDKNPHVQRLIVPGGWVYFVNKSTAVFVPEVVKLDGNAVIEQDLYDAGYSAGYETAMIEKRLNNEEA